MTTRFAERRSLVLACCLGLATLGGCTRRHTVAKTETGAPKYDTLRIVYEIRDGRGALGSNGLQPVQLVSATAGETTMVADHLWSTATLEIIYPHPEARAGYARAVLRLSPDRIRDDGTTATPPTNADPAPAAGATATAETTKAGTDGTGPAANPPSIVQRVRGIIPWGTNEGTSTGELAAPDPAANGTATAESTATGEEPSTNRRAAVDELWVLDLPREQLDLMLVDLARSGFFESQTRPVGGARFAVTLDKGAAEKAWDPDPRFDDLAERVYTEGWIQGFAETPKGPKAWWSLR